MGSRFPLLGMQTTSNFISVKVTNWFCFYYSDLYMLVNFFNGVLFPTYGIFFPKEGFGQGGFNEAPHAIKIAVLFYIPRRFYIPCSRPKGGPT